MYGMRWIDVSVLDAEQRSVLFLVYCARLSEREAAEELNEWWGRGYTRDRVHTVRLSAERALGRRAAELVST